MSGRPGRPGELTVDSDLTTTVMLAVLFVVLGLILARDIRQTLWGVDDHISIKGTMNRFGDALTLVYCLVFLFRWPNRLVKIGCALAAVDLIIRFLLTYLHFSRRLQPAILLARSAALQASLVTFLIAIAQWFRAVVRWEPQSREQREDR
jgi:hypothetical protein